MKRLCEFPTEIITEGLADIVVPRLSAFITKPSDYAPSKAPVFYNPVMELNRDLAILSLGAFQKLVNRDLRVCEPLAGCGVRGIRIAREVDNVKEVVLNDISEDAVRLEKINVEKNRLIHSVFVENKDANIMLSNFGAPRKRFDYVDIDPFGSPMPYVDSALRATRRNGLIGLTATDLAPLCGVHPKACIRKYGGRPLRTEYCHELALRLLAGALARSASKYDLGIRILFSHSSEHYVRLYSSIDYGAKTADASLKELGYVLHCFACFHRETSTRMTRKEFCPECGNKMSMAGPLWLGKILDTNFVTMMVKECKSRALRQNRRIRKLLSLAKEEADAALTYYRIDRICDKLGLRMPSPRDVIAKLRILGYRVSSTHFEAQGIKTPAPVQAVKETIVALAQGE